MEAFVYCWTDHLTKKLYVGSHKGTTDDGYDFSSKPMREEYNKRPREFTRQIIAEGDYKTMKKLEVMILKAVDAARNPMFYNRHVPGEQFHHIELHCEETKRKMKVAWSLERRAAQAKRLSEQNHSKRNIQLSDKHKQNLRKPKSKKARENMKGRSGVYTRTKECNDAHMWSEKRRAKFNTTLARKKSSSN
jgi:hypothetical protein